MDHYCKCNRCPCCGGVVPSQLSPYPYYGPWWGIGPNYGSPIAPTWPVTITSGTITVDNPSLTVTMGDTYNG